MNTETTEYDKTLTMTEADERRFFDKIEIGDDGVLRWIGSTFTDGYGAFRLNGKMVRAHRVAYAHFNGPIPMGLHVCHEIDEPDIVDPRYLWLGTQSDNIRDCVAKGRFNKPRGEAHHKAKLTECDVRAIRASDEPSTTLAQQYGVTTPNIINIRARRSWAHITDEAAA